MGLGWTDANDNDPGIAVLEGLAYLADALAYYQDQVAEEQRKLASSPQVSEMEWFASMLKAQADFTEGFAKMVGGAPFGQQSQG